MVANSERFKNDFPDTLKQTLNPTLATLFVQEKTKQFNNGEEYLFTVKEEKNRTIIGLLLNPSICLLLISHLPSHKGMYAALH